MEQQPHDRDNLSAEEADRAAEFERLVEAGIDLARQEDRRIDHLTAKRIAQELDPGSGPIHEFAETGAISEWIGADLESAQEVCLDRGLESRISWVLALEAYCVGRLLTRALPGWKELGADDST